MKSKFFISYNFTVSWSRISLSPYNLFIFFSWSK